MDLLTEMPKQEQALEWANDLLGSEAQIELVFGGTQIELFCGPPSAINLDKNGLWRRTSDPARYT